MSMSMSTQHLLDVYVLDVPGYTHNLLNVDVLMKGDEIKTFSMGLGPNLDSTLIKYRKGARKFP